jgi:protocatechuate 3,4-dioxygenase beta subunit
MSFAYRISSLERTAALVGVLLLAGTAVAAGPAVAAPAATTEKPAGQDAAAPASRVRVTPTTEAGAPLVVYVRIENAANGRPVPGAELFVYQTDDAGFYDRGEDGRERGPRGARLHATAHSDAEGMVVFDTVVPGSYPNSGIFRHIHYRLSAPGYESSHQEIILDEAPRPSEEQKRAAVRNGDLVAKRVNGKSGRSELRVTLKLQPSNGD